VQIPHIIFIALIYP